MSEKINLEEISNEFLGRNQEELIVPLILRVNKAEYSSIPAYSDNEDISGYYLNAKFQVTDFGITPIEEILFSGHANIDSGDIIIAYIHKYDVHEGKEIGIWTMEGPIYRKIFVERDYKKVEEVSKIEKICYPTGELTTFNGNETRR